LDRSRIRIYKKIKPEASEQSLVRIGRCATGFLILCGLICGIGNPVFAEKINLPAAEAIITGERLFFAKAKNKTSMWTSGQDRIVWTVKVSQPGLYRAALSLACDDRQAGSTIVLETGDQSLELTVPATGGWDTFKDAHFEPLLRLPAGESQVHLRAVPAGRLVGDVRGLTLEPAAGTENVTEVAAAPAGGPVRSQPADPREVLLTASAAVGEALPDRVLTEGLEFWRAPAGPQWLLADFQHSVEVSSVTIEWRNECAADYRVELSMDGEHFEEVVRVRDLSIPNRPRRFVNKPGEQIHRVEPAREARFLRVVLERAAVPDFGYGMVLLRVNGDNLTSFAPVPADAAYRDATLPPSQRADDLLSRMTFLEKMKMSSGFDAFFFSGLPRFGLRPILLNDSTSGIVIRSVDGRHGGNPLEESTAFPSAVALAANWDPELAGEMAAAIAREGRAHGTDFLLAPGINIQRTSTGGRNFEYFSEDPWLNSRLVVPYVRAIQEGGLVATVKHFAVNNHEFLRHQSNVIVDDRTLHEIYLPAFQAAIKEAGVGAVMSSYNWVNGEKAGESPWLLTEVLRGRLGFEGMVMSDWNGNQNRRKVPGSGQNIVMPHYRELHSEWLARHGADPEKANAEADAMIRPTLETLFKYGLWDRPRGGDSAFREGMKDHPALARRIAAGAITLLKNNGVLPLPNDAALLICGTEKAVLESSLGHGSGHIAGSRHTHYLDGLKDRFPQTRYAAQPDEATVQAASAVIYFFETGDAENRDHAFELPEATEQEIRRLAALNPNLIVVASSGTGFSADWVEDAGALVHAYYLGQERGRALADVLSGDVNPSGKLPFTIERDFADSPAYGDHLIDGEPLYEGHDPRFTGMTTHDVHYDEGIFVGYRWYDAKGKDVRFPFGFGLSYTTFTLDAVKVSGDRAGGESPLTVSVRLTNTGSRPGAEVIQCYVGSENPPVPRPLRELAAFRKVFLQPGESKVVEMPVPPRAFTYWCPEAGGWVTDPGGHRIDVGTSSRDIHESIHVR
jgi:beta-glucosidase